MANQQIPFGVTVTQERDWQRVAFRGSITEEAKPELMRLAASLAGKVLLDLEQVVFINSCGIRDWSFFLKALRPEREVVFDRVTEDIVRTMNMVVNFHARLPVRSLFRTYECRNCSHEEAVRFVEGKDYMFGEMPTTADRACAKCGNECLPAESDEEFFLFLVA